MERLLRVACYFRWMRNATPRDNADDAVATVDGRKTVEDDRGQDVGCNYEASRRLCGILESILLWENSVNSISVVVVFNILFWGIIVLEVRGFAAASSAALVIVLCYSTLEAQVQKENKVLDTAASYAKAEQIEKIGKKVKSAIHSLKQLRKDQPGVVNCYSLIRFHLMYGIFVLIVSSSLNEIDWGNEKEIRKTNFSLFVLFCTAVCSLSLGLWIIGRTINGVLLAYTICMSILLGPALLLKLPNKMIPHKEWDSEIEEFLPATTEDNLQVLTRAGESGDQSPTPTSVLSEAQNEFFNDDDLMGLRMPSHEDGSTDGVEVSELEFSAEETDVDGIKFQSGHFEKGSSSEEEAELEPLSRKSISHSDESGSEFEIIDSQEVDDLDIA